MLFQTSSSTRIGKESPVKKDSLSSGGHLQIKTSPSVHSRHSSAIRSTREKPATMPREHSPSKSRLSSNARDVSPGVVSVSESCDHFQVTHASQDPGSTKQNSRHSFSCDSSLPRSPPPYVHPKTGHTVHPGPPPCHTHSPRPGHLSADCGCTSCDCGYTSTEEVSRSISSSNQINLSLSTLNR